jgi:hypothetical protein
MTKAQDDYKALIIKHRPKGGSGTGMGWVKKLSESVQKKIAAAKEAADASVDATISAGQRMAEAFLPNLPRGPSTDKRRAAKAAKAQERADKKDDATSAKLEEHRKNLTKKKPPLPLKEQEVAVLKATPAKPHTKTAKDKSDDARKFVTANFGKNVELKSPDVSKSNLNRAEKALAANKDDGLTEGDYGTRAGTAAIRGFFKDTLGIENIEVDYTFPGDEGYGTPQGKKSGGKVTPKRAPTKKPTKSSTSSTKKYAMNKGGKVASVRKPTRA